MKITLDDVARFPRPGTAAPARLRFSPDGKRLTYLWSEAGTLARTLWEVDLATGERREIVRPPDEGATDANVSREEALRRERARLRETGITHYDWADDAPVLIAPIRGDVYAWPGMRKIAERAETPKLTPDGKTPVFVREGALWAGERRLSRGEGVTHGLAEFNAQEELGRHDGFWISPDSRRVAFQEVDERHIPVYPIVHQGKDSPEVEPHRYPFAGGPNARWRLGVVSIDGGPVQWLDLRDEYLARVNWSPDGRLWTQTLSRDQRRLELRAEGRTVLVEEADVWINLHHDLRFLPGGRFVWSSERTGFRHLYLDGGTPLTQGDWSVDAVSGVSGEWSYFTASKEGPLERQGYRVSSAGKLERLTRDPGSHDLVVSKDGRWVDLHASTRVPPRVLFEGRTLYESKVDLAGPELASFKSRDGAALYAAVYKPSRLPAPLIVSVYGGPHHQAVQDDWLLTVDLRAQHLAQRGFVVLKVDNRGSARRGLDFERAIERNMGDVEVRDQVDGVRWAKSRGLATDRVGIYGWSYGGYMTLMCLCRAPEVFACGVAGAPVTSWDGYDTGYTERYMSTPQENPEGYRASSVMTHAANLRGRLMLVHGMLDENVHFRHTARIVEALNAANKRYELLAYPNERHMPRSEAGRRAMEQRIVEFFESNLR
ncbi:MAG TPA: prolyl oligopeptidase family serine peptidase [Planctomycetota bacterium]|nr:prolyl oligopeptidase family serine peptidase [Planctomycetota bacterium]